MTGISGIDIEPSWREKLLPVLEREYMPALREGVRARYCDPKARVCPHPKNLFHAFNACPFGAVRVVILGQDPYHGAGQAHGLSFSVPEGVRIPPSLRNIFKEIESDVGTPPPAHGDLTRWARQGVFLLNAVLTVETGKPASHRDVGWERFTDDVISLLSDNREHVVFMLWGGYAKRKRELIDGGRHLILTAPHPSPYSAANGFFGCGHFGAANEYLVKNGAAPVVW